MKSDTGLNMRAKPNGLKVGVLPHNSEFQILDQVSFYRVKTQEGQIGYLHGDFIEKLPDENSISDTETDNYVADFKPVTYSNEFFIGEKVTVDQDFVADLNRVAQFASDCELKVWVTSSIRAINNQIQGAIVKPATRSCHHIGHAIDMNLMYQGKLYNSKKLRKSNHHQLPDSILKFIQLLREDDMLRWGGDFRNQDPVHIDDNFYNKNKLLYHAKLERRLGKLNGT